MRLLLDTSALIWWVMEDSKLSRVGVTAIMNASQVYVSSISAMEIATKFRIGKLPEVGTLINEFQERLANEGFDSLVLSNQHALLAGNLPGSHRDPFDRMLAAQAQVEDIAIVSGDMAFDALGARRIW
jgi:PIN domain nuclease of toxin-antitoxin system